MASSTGEHNDSVHALRTWTLTHDLHKWVLMKPGIRVGPIVRLLATQVYKPCVY